MHARSILLGRFRSQSNGNGSHIVTFAVERGSRLFTATECNNWQLKKCIIEQQLVHCNWMQRDDPLSLLTRNLLTCKANTLCTMYSRDKNTVLTKIQGEKTKTKT